MSNTTKNRIVTTKVVRGCCPVCQGRGIVPQGFYTYPAAQDFTSNFTGPDKCRACGGHGWFTTTETTSVVDV